MLGYLRYCWVLFIARFRKSDNSRGSVLRQLTQDALAKRGMIQDMAEELFDTAYHRAKELAKDGKRECSVKVHYDGYQGGQPECWREVEKEAERMACDDGIRLYFYTHENDRRVRVNW